MVADARANTKTFFETYYDPAEAKKDDDASLLGVQFMYNSPDYPLTLEFKAPSAIDVIVGLGKPVSQAELDGDLVVRRYTEYVPVTIIAVDRTGVTGTLACWNVESALREICRQYPTGSQRSIRRIRETDEQLGSTTLYKTELELTYRRGIT